VKAILFQIKEKNVSASKQKWEGTPMTSLAFSDPTGSSLSKDTDI
jgi:hypothetical protein